MFTGQLVSGQENRLRNRLTFLRLGDGEELVLRGAGDGWAKKRHDSQQLTLIRVTENCPNRTDATKVSVNGQTVRKSDTCSIGQVNADRRSVKEFTDAFHSLPSGYASVVRKAEGATKVATEHPETQSPRSGVSMEERLLLNGVNIECADIAPRDIQLAAFIEPDPTNARQAVKNDAPVPAGETLNSVGKQFFGHTRFFRYLRFIVLNSPIQFALSDELSENLGYGHLLRLFDLQPLMLKDWHFPHLGSVF